MPAVTVCTNAGALSSAKYISRGFKGSFVGKYRRPLLLLKNYAQYELDPNYLVG